MDGTADRSELLTIPLVEARRDGPIAVVQAERARFEVLFRAGRAHYGPLFLSLGDRLTKTWLDDCPTPYRADLDACAAAHPGAGVYMLNLSYEWSCTTAVGVPPSGRGNRLLRTLDWPLKGLGRNVVVARMAGAAGPWFNVAWPGFAGAATAMAPGRFAAALNQPPMKKYTSSCWLDWAVERTRVWRRRLLPPTHLLRWVFETCETYENARAVLAETPIAVPAFFSLSGVDGHQGCVIERTETAAFIRDGGNVSIANHWVKAPIAGRARGLDSPGRFALMEACRDRVEDGFDWVRAPILNPTTRLAVTANALTGSLQVRGYEPEGPVTRDFAL
ncbi:MAG: hypothetical protein COW30_17920 [Rhodospirillales bacterium CG15_BIG_FIL_POST_REV_8_21_14_020_66_15]|nr:MAG: hypothetical protein COW30_17920 [Rhodospirillales bacterium CG15_BIG_FIL_POST_REV_8_21_14_020_66_15]